MRLLRQIAVCGVVAMGTALAHAETGAEAWLRYAPLPDAERAKYASLPASVFVLGDSPLLRSAQQEMIGGIKGWLGKPWGKPAARHKKGCFVWGRPGVSPPTARNLNSPTTSA